MTLPYYITSISMEKVLRVMQGFLVSTAGTEKSKKHLDLHHGGSRCIVCRDFGSISANLGGSQFAGATVHGNGGNLAQIWLREMLDI